jgi:hypothetical protein
VLSLRLKVKLRSFHCGLRSRLKMLLLRDVGSQTLNGVSSYLMGLFLLRRIQVSFTSRLVARSGVSDATRKRISKYGLTQLEKPLSEFMEDNGL